MIKKIVFVLFASSLLLAGCAAAKSANDLGVQESLVERQSPVEAPAAAPLAGEKSSYALDQSAASVDRLVIKNASLSIAVDDPLKSMDNISHMAEAMGGFVVSADMYQQSLSNGVKVPQVSLTIRVPAERLDEALSTIKTETNQPIITPWPSKWTSGWTDRCVKRSIRWATSSASCC